jgi:hypothetical protein
MRRGNRPGKEIKATEVEEERRKRSKRARKLSKTEREMGRGG